MLVVFVFDKEKEPLVKAALFKSCLATGRTERTMKEYLQTPIRASVKTCRAHLQSPTLRLREWRSLASVRRSRSLRVIGGAA